MSENAEILDLSAFKHALVPIGVLVGLGMSRVVVAVSHYIEHRERVRFSTIHAVWTSALLLLFIGFWWELWDLRTIQTERMTFPLLIYLFVGPCFIYLPSTLLLPQVPESGELDLGSVFERVSRPVYLSLGGFVLWLATSQVFIRGQPVLDPPRAIQGALVVTFVVAALFPSRRLAAAVSVVTLLLVGLSLATVRAKLA